jgi:glycosyltransferase involved in cell wall biosynthesis
LGSRSEQETESTCPPLVSIVVPVYNEAHRIAATLDAVDAWVRASACRAEILVADDGSTDDTADIVNQYVPATPWVHLIELPHGGKARAVLAGLRMARGDIVGFMDADLATPLSTLHTALDVLQKGADVVIGSREGPGASRVGEPWYRHAMGRVFNSLVRWTLLPGIQDSQCGFKFMTRDARDRILPRVRLYTSEQTVAQARVTAFDVELLFIARLRDMTVHIIPVAWEYGNQSKVNPVADTLQNLEDVARVWLNGKRGLYQRER